MAKTAKPTTKKSAPAKKAGTSKVSGDTILKQYEEIKTLTTEMEEDVRKLVDENVKAAAKRVRAGAQGIKKICGQIRKDAITYVKAIKK